MKSITILIVAALAGCSGADPSTTGDDMNATGKPAVVGDPKVLPIPAMTPGDVLTNDLKALCKVGYPATVRNIPDSEKTAVAEAYHYTGPNAGVEYDHLISLELGGSNDRKNLWPQPIEEAHIKDQLENYLHKEVCAGNMPLADAQKQIAADWIALWKKVGKL